MWYLKVSRKALGLGAVGICFSALREGSLRMKSVKKRKSFQDSGRKLSLTAYHLYTLVNDKKEQHFEKTGDRTVIMRLTTSFISP